MDSTSEHESSGRSTQGLSDEHLRVLGSIVTALGHLDLMLLRTVRDLVPGADGPSVEALLIGDTTPELATKLDRLVKQHHGGEPICAQVVSWCVAVNAVYDRWNQEFHASWLRDRPDDALTRVRYTKTAYFGGLPVEETGLDDLRDIAHEVTDRMTELEAFWAQLNPDYNQEPDS
jgi:hypothetical protein